MKATLKNGLRLLFFPVLVSIMTSCFFSKNYEEILPLNDAELLYFGLYSDSVPDLKEVVFTIDHRGPVGAIYNRDSMAYQTKIKGKVMVSYISGADLDNVFNITAGDSVRVLREDSFDISTPQTLKVIALDGKTSKKYVVQLNIHQVDPDSTQYHQIASGLPFLQSEDTKTVLLNDIFLTYSKIGPQVQLHSSPDAVNWTPYVPSGLPLNVVVRGIYSNRKQIFAYTDNGELYVRNDPVSDLWVLANKPASVKIKSILGYLPASAKQNEGLCLIIETNGINTFAFTEDFIQWEYDDSTPVPEDFPLNNFSVHCYRLMLTGRVSVFGGISQSGALLNTVWSTENGLYWAKLSGNRNLFPPLEGINVFYYNGEFWLINGKSGSNYNREVYYSIDGGITWRIKPEKFKTHDNYSLRYNASVVVDKDNKRFFIIGGKQGTEFSDIWRGVLNKMEFDY